MSKYSSQLLVKLQAQELVSFIAFDMKIDDVWYRYTDCDVPLWIDGHKYTPAVLQPGDVVHETDSCISSFSFRISSNTFVDADTTFGDVFINGSPRRSQMISRMVFVDATNHAAYAVNLLNNPGFESGVLGDWHLHVQNGCAASASVIQSPYESRRWAGPRTWGGPRTFADTVKLSHTGDYAAFISITDGWGDAESSSTLESSAEEYHVKDIMFQQHLSCAIEAGTLYDLVFAAKASVARKMAVGVGVQKGEDFPAFYNVDLGTEWDFYMLPFIAGEDIAEGLAALNFYLAREDSDADVWIDQVRFSNSLYPITVFKGYIDGWHWDEDFVDVDVVCALAAWNQKTIRRIGPSCRYLKFKGEECQYAGVETWCDRIYKRCHDLGNTANFGGFRWLPSIIGQTLWWGRNPYYVPGPFPKPAGGTI